MSERPYWVTCGYCHTRLQQVRCEKCHGAGGWMLYPKEQEKT